MQTESLDNFIQHMLEKLDPYMILNEDGGTTEDLGRMVYLH
jgi:hypothetical protein